MIKVLTCIKTKHSIGCYELEYYSFYPDIWNEECWDYYQVLIVFQRQTTLNQKEKKSWTSEKNNSDTAIGYFLLPG